MMVACLKVSDSETAALRTPPPGRLAENLPPFCHFPNDALVDRVYLRAALTDPSTALPRHV